MIRSVLQNTDTGVHPSAVTKQNTLETHANEQPRGMTSKNQIAGKANYPVRKKVLLFITLANRLQSLAWGQTARCRNSLVVGA